MKTMSGHSHGLPISGRTRSKLTGVKSPQLPNQYRLLQGRLHADWMTGNDLHTARHAGDPLLETVIIPAGGLLPLRTVDLRPGPPTPDDTINDHRPPVPAIALHTDDLGHQYVAHVIRPWNLQAGHRFQESEVLPALRRQQPQSSCLSLCYQRFLAYQLVWDYHLIPCCLTARI